MWLRATRVVFVAVVVLGSSFGLAQTELTLVPDWVRLTLGPFVGRTDDVARFFVDASLPFLGGVSGQLVEVTGASLAGMQITIRLEPRLGLSAILGIGNIGTVWFQLGDYAWEAISRFTFDFGGPKPVLTVADVFVDLGLWFGKSQEHQIKRADGDKLKVMLGGVDHLYPREVARFASKPDIKEIDRDGKPKYPNCTYIAVEKWIPYTKDLKAVWVEFYHSDGTKWGERVGDKVEIFVYESRDKVQKDLPKGTYFLVKEKDDVYRLHKALGGNWHPDLGEWKTLAPQSEPTEEPPEQEEPGEPGEPSAG